MAASKKSPIQGSKSPNDRLQPASETGVIGPGERSKPPIFPPSTEAKDEIEANESHCMDVQQVIQDMATQLASLGRSQINPKFRSVGASFTLKWHVEITVGPDEPTESEPTNNPIEFPKTALELTSELLQYPGAWLKTPNENLGGRPPIDLIGTDEEEKVSNLLNAVKYGLFS